MVLSHHHLYFRTFPSPSKKPTHYQSPTFFPTYPEDSGSVLSTHSSGTVYLSHPQCSLDLTTMFA